jgi:hypothetical protein
MADQTEQVPVVTFKLIEFNPRRHSRGVEAARVEVFEDDESVGLLWMCEHDIRKNISESGDSDELQNALAEYRKHRRR